MECCYAICEVDRAVKVNIGCVDVVVSYVVGSVNIDNSAGADRDSEGNNVCVDMNVSNVGSDNVNNDNAGVNRVCGFYFALSS